MKKLRINHNEQGFTLIELMIVIAIIGILAAIAIPNFVAYRNKAFCTTAESDANSIAAAVSDYFSIPTNQGITNASYTAYTGAYIPPDNTFFVTATDPNVAITISVTDASGRCPAEYRTASATSSANDKWDGGSTFIYRKVITN